MPNDKGLESRLSAWFDDQARAVGGFVNSIESPLTCPGFPDKVLLRGRETFFVELKTCSSGKSPRHAVSVAIREDQKTWHESAYQAGVETYFLIQVGKGAKSRRFLLPWASLRGGGRITEEKLSVESVPMSRVFGGS